MGLLDVFKKKEKEIKKEKTSLPSKKGPLLKPIEDSKKTEKEIKQEVKEVKKVKTKRPDSVTAPAVKQRAALGKKVLGKSYRILHSPHVTEKATRLTEKNQYVFKIWDRTNKNEVKQAVESTYGVDVVGIRIINIPRKKRKLGRHKGWKKGYKKAIVKIKKGQKIEILPR